MSLLEGSYTTCSRRSKLDNGGVLGVFTKHDIFSTNHMLIEMVKEKPFFVNVAQNYTMMEFWRLYKN